MSQRYTNAARMRIMQLYGRWVGIIPRGTTQFGETAFTMVRRRYPKLRQSTLRRWLLLWDLAAPQYKRGYNPDTHLKRRV